jgi:hypothetical protein
MTKRSGLQMLLAITAMVVWSGTAAAQDEDASPSAAPSASAEPSESAPPADDTDPGTRRSCIEDVCRVTAEAVGTGEEAAGAGTAEMEGADLAGPLVCTEGEGTCVVLDPSRSLEEYVAKGKARKVHALVDDDPSGDWRTTNLPTRVRCTIAGSGTSTVKLKRTRGRATIEQQENGDLVAQSARAGEEPFVMLRLGPGLYGSLQPFSDGNVSGEIVSYYGMLSEDRIEGTAVVTSTLRDGGPRTDCWMKRNFDMKRLSDPTE